MKLKTSDMFTVFPKTNTIETQNNQFFVGNSMRNNIIKIANPESDFESVEVK